MPTTFDSQPVTAGDKDQRMLGSLAEALSSSDTLSGLKLVEPQGETLDLPESVTALLREVVHALAHHKAVRVIALDRELTTQVAANLLNVSRPYLIRLLDQGIIPYTRTGSHRRIRFDDLMRYKAERDAARERALDELTQLNEEMGLYENEQPTV